MQAAARYFAPRYFAPRYFNPRGRPAVQIHPEILARRNARIFRFSALGGLRFGGSAACLIDRRLARLLREDEELLLLLASSDRAWW